ncbi:MAG: calcium-binding protein [Zoogloea oleivorans]|jgi:Ca2+-binding RTX toxin-like protein|uniref:beta strand repeat-containing protein n=1 Tax=Zoogloea oleivorans TaxID=1552750 RepID=UPI002A3612A8|nr:calcium-binding protein [Zoogloea oleivorans]MDY0035159.1 calcium-binding protein [Zoogloea oleivorans]
MPIDSTASSTVYGSSSDETLVGSAGNDTFQLTTGGDANGTDQFIGGGGVNTIVGGWSADTLHVTDGLANLQDIQVLDGGDGAWQNNVILATDASDTLDFSAVEVRNFIIDGGAGNDTITGTAGDDHIRGGTGNDVLNGGAGNDTFLLITAGDTNGTDMYDGGTGINAIVGGWSYDTLHVLDQLSNLQNIQVLDGGDTTWQYNTILATDSNDTLDFSSYQVNNFIIDGAAGNDVITGTSAGDYIRGGTGDDVLAGGAGDDTFLLITAGDTNGTDMYDGGTGINAIVGGWSYDTLHVRDQLSNLQNIQVLDGGDTTWQYNTILATGGNDTLDFSTYQVNNFIIDGSAGNDVITGTAGADHILGGTGNDVLSGGAGDDTFLLLTGSDANGSDRFYGGTGINAIVGGWSFDTLRVMDRLANLVDIQVLDGGDSNLGYNTVMATDASDTLDFSGMTVNNFIIDGGAGNDTITGTTGNDYIRGGLGADLLIGGGGNDVLLGGAGNDIFRLNTGGDLSGYDSYDGGTGVNTIIGGWSYDVLHVASDMSNLKGIQVIDGGDTTWAYNTIAGTSGDDRLDFTGKILRNCYIDGGLGNDRIVGTAAGDFIRGGGGNDVLIGAGGNDLFILNTGGDLSGVDQYDGGNGINGIVGGWSYDVLYVNDQLSNLKNIQVIDGGDGNWGYNTIRGTAANETLDFSALEIYDFAIDGGAGNDAITGTVTADHITGGAGSNLLKGGLGDDFLTAGVGRDLLVGGRGNDEITTSTGTSLIAFNTGDGHDTVNAINGDNNALSLGGLASYGDLAFSKSGDDLVLSIGASDGVTIKNWYTSVGSQKLVTLQVLTGSMTDFAPGSSDTLRDQRVETFDFGELVSSFDQARTSDPTLSSWSLTHSLLTTHLSGSDSAALGGNLAYQYGTTGDLSSVGIVATQGILQDSSFLSSPQAFAMAP